MSETTKEYQRGYAAGLRRADRERREHDLQMARYALAASIAPEIVRSPWQQGGKSLNTPEGVAGTIAGIVSAIEKRL